MIKPIDEKYRIQAVTDVSHDLMVEAGAGTGKTTLLVQRTVQAIVEGGIDVDRVVLITFMEKAAHEIRVRLAQALETIEGEGLGRARKALRHLGQARITTIHGFCMDILQRHAISAGVPVGFAVLDPIEADRLWDEVFDHWIQTSQDLNVVLEDFQAANVGMHQVRDMVRIISQWDDIEQTSYEAPLCAQTLDRIAEDVEAWTQTAMVEADPNDAGRRQIEDLRRFLRSRGEDAWDWIRTLQSWPAGAPKGNKKGWHNPERLAAQKTWLKEDLMPDIAGRQTQLADFLMGSLIRVTRREFLPLYQQRRFSLGMLSFDDLLLRTRDLLRNQDAVVQAIAKSFDLMMVDEFQDTDPVQTEIIMRLTQDRAGVLFLVGDPKQAIYRFRGADVELYAEVRSQWEQRPDAAVLPIFHNFRSDPQILSAVNQYFAQKFPAQADPLRPYVPVYYPLQTHGSEDGRIRVVLD
ncbi:MAG: UvrD-helicase domain-containing protein [Sulfobacillus sp.]